ncbi:MAG: aminotransferase class IV [Candidatus Latescibacteria bacterium]|nr:aminotransferase class IV [Candidatus Latescibacterota bacterium]
MANRVVYFNGEWVSEREARVSIFDSALMFGDMAFEMTRTFNQKPFKLREHLERLYASLKLMEIDCGLTIDHMEQITLEGLKKNLSTEPDDMDWQIMHDVSRGVMGFYEPVFPEGVQPTVSINYWPMILHAGTSAVKYDAGIDLVIPAQQAVPAHLIDPKTKNRSRVYYQLANLQASRMNNGTPLLLDPDGYLTESTGANVFLVKNNVLYTPEPRNILLGVSRDTVIELAEKLNIPVVEKNMGRYEALMADEMFMTSTPFCMMHAATFEGQTIGDGKRGPIFTQLANAWKDLVDLDFVAQAHAYEGQMEAWKKRELEANR